MKRPISMALIAALALVGCGEEEKSVEYYKAHLEEARNLSARCMHNADAGLNCGNAAVAIQEMARETFRRNQQRTQQNIEGGSWQPTWNGQ